MHNFLEIISEPDNIAILIMMAATITCTLVAFREIRINDRLIKEGKKEKIYERMTK
jgi:methanogenic corrinoid protein MtbC1